MTHLIVTIDGPASSGKGTLAKRLADMFDMAYLDTGLLYRHIGLAAVTAGIAADDSAGATALAQKMAATLNWADLANPDLRGVTASRAASVYAIIPGVRRALDDIQKGFAATPPTHMNGKPCRGVVLDGRDMGTVIAPQARVKFYVTAAPEIRAKRRVADQTARGFTVDYDTVLADLRARDTRDAPNMIPAPDAIMIDTTDLSIDETVAFAATKMKPFLPYSHLIN